MPSRCLIKIAFVLAAVPFVMTLARAETASSPTNADPQSCTLPAKRMQRLELIFGLSGQNGPVTPRAWATFVEREVSPRFPDGFSIFDGHGQWRNTEGKITRESSRLLLIWYERDATSDGKIEAIREAYKKHFHQESVLRVDEVSCVSF